MGAVFEVLLDEDEVMEALFKAAPPDDIGGDGRGESITSEAKEILGRWKVEMQSGGHGKNGALGRMEVRVGDESGVGGAGDARSAIEGDGITSVDGVDSLSECVAEGPDIARAGNVEGDRVVRFIMIKPLAYRKHDARGGPARLRSRGDGRILGGLWGGGRLWRGRWGLGGRVGKKVTVIFDQRPIKMRFLSRPEQCIVDGREDVHGAGIVQKRQPISRGESR